MIFVSRRYYRDNVHIHIQLALSHMLIKNEFWLPLWYLWTNPSYAIKEFINFDVKNNFKNVILLNYALRQYIKENHQ